jgi:Rps23 Pro-64 3,4-dihydroxylase Tpa1-like proline 4-hydroxylase
MSHNISASKILSIKNYLKKDEKEKLLTNIISKESQFTSVNNPTFSNTIKDLFCEEIHDMFQERFNNLNIGKIIKDEFNCISDWEKVVQKFSKDKIMHIFAFSTGVEIIEHLDDLDEDGNLGDKRITLLYSLFKNPKTFTGGDFIVRDRYVDTNNSLQNNFFPKEGVKIELEDNSLTIFDAAYPHQLTKIINSNNSFDNSLFLVFMQVF